MKRFEYYEDIAPSDCAFKAYGRDLPELFINAALALTSCMVDLATVESQKSYAIDLTADTTELLLYDWLEELVFIKDTEGLFLKDFIVEIEEQSVCCLTAQTVGAKINYKTQDIFVDVKAVTMYKFELKETDTGWEAFVVLDL